MRKDLMLGIGATLIAMALFYFADHPTAKLNIGKNKIDSDSDYGVPATKKVLNSEDNEAARVVVSAPSAALKAGAARDTISKNFAEHLKEIGTCLKINAAIDNPTIEPTYDNLLVSLRPAIGELVVQMDDWTQMDLQNPDGTRKRLRTEVNYENPNTPVKYVQLYNINEQGFPEMQQVDAEKARNPSDDYINYLRGGANLVLDERGSRVYFQEGEEIVLVERAGVIESLSMTKNGKTVSCTGLDAATSNCQCSQ
ncbi:hypothetical protein CIK05_02385 [Bdellovibrio sp. qaytius]|nr:hypothetical protein CIK05_02385 [Bdellovibrio sp. qaytius]